MDQLAGFRLYLETAESDRLNLSAPEITADRFESLLPYAVALDVEKPWSDAFAAAVRRAHPDDPDPMSSYQPRWSSGGWSGSNFSNAVSSSVASMGDTSATGVAFTRNPSTGEKKLYGEFLINAQGEDVVAGIRTPQEISEAARKEAGSDKPSMEYALPKAYAELKRIYNVLERHYRDMPPSGGKWRWGVAVWR